MQRKIKPVKRAGNGRFFLAAAALAGCGSPNDKTADGGAGVADLSAAVDMARAARDFAHVELPTGGVKGVLFDEAGKPQPMVQILACNPSVCMYGTTGGDGSFQVDKLQLGGLAVKTQEDLTMMPARGEAIQPVLLTMQNVTVDIGKLYIPTLGPGGLLMGAEDMSMPQVIDAGDGVTLTVRRTDLDLPFGTPKKPALAARLVPPERRPTLDVGGEKIVGTWALSPFETKSSSKVAVKVKLALAANTEVHFRTISELNGALSDPAIGHEAMDGLSAATDANQGIDNLTWLIVTTK